MTSQPCTAIFRLGQSLLLAALTTASLRAHRCANRSARALASWPAATYPASSGGKNRAARPTVSRPGTRYWMSAPTGRPVLMATATRSPECEMLVCSPDHGGSGQLLVYPNTDQLADDQSMRAADDPFLFNRHSVAWYRQYYLADPPTRPIRWPRRFAPRAWPGCLPPSSSPLSTTRCATRARRTPGGWPTPACRSNSAATRAWRTGSSRWPAPLTPAGPRSSNARRSCRHG